MIERIFLIAKEGDHFFAPGADVFPYENGKSYLLSREEYDAVAACRTPALTLVGPSKVDGARIIAPLCFLEHYDRHVEYVPDPFGEVDTLQARIAKLEEKLAEWEGLRDVSQNIVPGMDGMGEEADPTPHTVREHLTYLQAEWDAAELRAGKIRKAIQEVIDAWTVPGPVSHHHTATQRDLHNMWPTLARAVERLVNCVKP
jgi:hypothetical protein